MSNTGEQPPRGGVKSLVRAFQILEAVAGADTKLGGAEITQRVRLPVATTHRLIGTLSSLGYLSRANDAGFQVGAGWLRLRDAAIRALPSVARPHLARLVDHFGESASLIIRSGTEALHLVHLQSRRSMRAELHAGHTTPLHQSAAGMAILANISEPDRTEVCKQALMTDSSQAPRTADLQRLIHRLTVVAAHGYAVDWGEHEPGLHSLAVAVPDAPTAMAIAITAPDARLTATLVERAVSVLKDAATILSADLG